MQKWDKNVKMQRFIICLKSALHNYLKLLEQIIFQCYNKVTKRYRLEVRIADSHSVDTGSNPVAADNFLFSIQKVNALTARDFHQRIFF